jgi:hypothetical protein
MAGNVRARVAQFVFFALGVDELRDPERRISLSGDDIAVLNPNTRTCPIFRTRRDVEITKAIYRRVPVLIRKGPPQENPWGITFARMFDMSNDSHLFRTREQLERAGWKLDGNIFFKGQDHYLPLYEAKLFHQFDHRFAVYDPAEPRDMTDAEKSDPSRLVVPRYWVSEQDVEEALSASTNAHAAKVRDRQTDGRTDGRKYQTLVRLIARATDFRTVVSTIVPRYAVNNKAAIVQFGAGDSL